MVNNPQPFNVDQSEINKFSAMASEWWDPNGKFKPLHTINPLRVEYILSQVGNLANKSVLDVGCGGGILSESLAKLGAQTTAIDMAELSLNIAKAHAKEQHLTIDYRLESIEQHLAQTEQRYDVITCMEMLEHVPDPQSIIRCCAKLLNPQGKLFLSTINRNHKSRLMLIIGAEYIARIIPKGTHDFNKFIRPSELMGWIQQAGLKTQAFIGIEYHLLGNMFTLGPNIDVNYITYATNK